MDSARAGGGRVAGDRAVHQRQRPTIDDAAALEPGPAVPKGEVGERDRDALRHPQDAELRIRAPPADRDPRARRGNRERPGDVEGAAAGGRRGQRDRAREPGREGDGGGSGRIERLSQGALAGVARAVTRVGQAVDHALPGCGGDGFIGGR